MLAISMQHGTEMGKRSRANERFEKQKMRYEMSERAGECIADGDTFNTLIVKTESDDGDEHDFYLSM